MNSRIKELRNLLNISRSEFGSKLGVSSEVIKNLEYGRVETKQYMINLICKTFFVNEKWLRYEEEPIFIDSVEIALNTLKESLNLDKVDLIFLDKFSKLDKNLKTSIVNFLVEVSEEIKTTTSKVIKPHPTMYELEALNYKFNTAPISRFAAFGGGITEVPPPKKPVDLDKDFKE